MYEYKLHPIQLQIMMYYDPKKPREGQNQDFKNWVNYLVTTMDSSLNSDVMMDKIGGFTPN